MTSYSSSVRVTASDSGVFSGEKESNWGAQQILRQRCGLDIDFPPYFRHMPIITRTDKNFKRKTGTVDRFLEKE